MPRTPERSYDHMYRHRSSDDITSSSITNDNRKSNGRTRWIIALGLLLPALAAVLGVVAWTVSAEAVIGPHRQSALKSHGLFQKHNDEKSKEKKTENDDKKKSNSTSKNLYFLSSDPTLTGSAQTLLTPDPSKKSAGARVAEVIDKLVALRKKEGGSHHIVVVAPTPSQMKPQPTPMKRAPEMAAQIAPKTHLQNGNSDPLIAAAHMIAQQVIRGQQPQITVSSPSHDDKREIDLVIEPSPQVYYSRQTSDQIASHSTPQNSFVIHPNDHFHQAEVQASYQPYVARRHSKPLPRPPGQGQFIVHQMPPQQHDYYDYEPPTRPNRFARQRQKDYYSESQRNPSKYIEEESEEDEEEPVDEEEDSEERPVRRPGKTNKDLVFNLNDGGNLDKGSMQLFRNILYPLLPKSQQPNNQQGMNGKLVFGFLLDKKKNQQNKRRY